MSNGRQTSTKREEKKTSIPVNYYWRVFEFTVMPTYLVLLGCCCTAFDWNSKFYVAIDWNNLFGLYNEAITTKTLDLAVFFFISSFQLFSVFICYQQNCISWKKNLSGTCPEMTFVLLLITVNLTRNPWVINYYSKTVSKDQSIFPIQMKMKTILRFASFFFFFIWWFIRLLIYTKLHFLSFFIGYIHIYVDI